VDITYPFILICFCLIVAGLFLWKTSEEARIVRHIQYLRKTQGYRAAWLWWMAQPQWQHKRDATKKAFYGLCAGCGDKGSQAHHRSKKAYQNMGREKPIRDLTWLCASCHSKMPRSDGLYPG
jgi:hypothetical protein